MTFFKKTEGGRMDSLYRDTREQKIVFFLVTAGVLTLTYGLLFLIDFLPEKPTTENEQLEIVEEAVVVEDVVAESEPEAVTPTDPNPVAFDPDFDLR